jgi:hypothetical protein
MWHPFFGTNEMMYYAAGFGFIVLMGGVWRAARTRRQQWAENQSWRELMVRMDRERSGSLG